MVMDYNLKVEYLYTPEVRQALKAVDKAIEVYQRKVNNYYQGRTVIGGDYRRTAKLMLSSDKQYLKLLECKENILKNAVPVAIEVIRCG